MSKKELIDLCLLTQAENVYLADKVKALQERNEQVAGMFQEMKIMFQATKNSMRDSGRTQKMLRKELHDEIATLRKNMASHEKELVVFAKKEARLRSVVGSQTRAVESLKCDLLALQSELSVMRVSACHRVENIKALLRQAKECIKDPVTLEPLDDPITLLTGHTYSRVSLLPLMAQSETGDRVTCPMTRTVVKFPGKGLDQFRKNIFMTQLIDIILQLDGMVDE
jgi:hypothetical protein